MSKIGKIPVIIKEGVTVSYEGNKISVTGPKGSLFFNIPLGIKAETKGSEIIVSQEKETEEKTRALFGLTRAMIANLVEGVTEGFEKKLELSGVGYRAQGAGNTLTLSLGFSHPVIIKAAEGIDFKVEENIITITGINKEEIGDIAAKVRSMRPPEPYKGKGIKYLGEHVRRKAGKAAKAVGGAGAGAK